MKAIILALILFTSLYGNPQNPEVISGNVQFEEEASSLYIHTDEKAIIEWESFSITEKERTCFFQPSSESIVLNRVLGMNGSEIFGSLQSNGYLFLINPLGILIGKDATIDVGGLVASTLDLQNVDFEEKKWHFFGPSEEAVKNLGNIETKGGHIALIGKRVENLGLIDAKGGLISLIGTNEVVIQLEDGPIFYRTQIIDEEDSSSSFIHNEEDDIEVIEEDGEVYVLGPSDVKNLGIIQSEGGEVYLLGDQIDLAEDSIIDVSHNDDAGNVYIGGYQGHSYANFANLGIFADKDSQILAYSSDNGNGGKVILYSQGGNSFNGLIFARGGPNGGNGGSVQISGLERLIFQGNVDIFAPHGYMGSFFISPFIEIK